MVNVREGWENRPERFPHSHRNTFPDSVPADARRKWLEEGVANTRKTLGRDVNVVVDETANGFEFKFESYDDYAAFMLSTFGEMEGKHSHTHSHEFVGDQGCDVAWMEGAECYLQALGIDYAIEMKGNEALFKFDRMSDSVSFNYLVQSGRIEDLIERGMTDQFDQDVAAFHQKWRPILDQVTTNAPNGMG